MARHVSSGAARILQRDAHCHVHSTFQRAMNIRIGDDLVLLAPEGRRESADCPFGIEVAAGDWARIRSGLRSGSLGARWRWHSEQRTFTAGKTLVLAVGSPADAVDPIAVAPPVPQVFDLQASIPAGAPAPGLFQHHDAAEVNAHLRAARNALTGGGQLQDVLWLIGRGPGLTPSGDDALVGILAALTACGQVSQGTWTRLARTIERDGDLLTTDVSCAYLLCAVRGEFGRSVADVMDALVDQTRLHRAVQRLAQHGHTSGVDLLLGLNAALEPLDYAKSA